MPTRLALERMYGLQIDAARPKRRASRRHRIGVQQDADDYLRRYTVHERKPSRKHLSIGSAASVQTRYFDIGVPQPSPHHARRPDGNHRWLPAASGLKTAGNRMHHQRAAAKVKVGY